MTKSVLGSFFLLFSPFLNRFGPDVTPDAPAVLAAIENALN